MDLPLLELGEPHSTCDQWTSQLKVITLQRRNDSDCKRASSSGSDCDIIIRCTEPNTLPDALCHKTCGSQYSVVLADSQTELFSSSNKANQLCQAWSISRHISIGGQKTAVLSFEKQPETTQTPIVCYSVADSTSPLFTFYLQRAVRLGCMPCSQRTSHVVRGAAHTKNSCRIATVTCYPCSSEAAVRVDFDPAATSLEKLLLIDAAIYTFEQRLQSPYCRRTHCVILLLVLLVVLAAELVIFLSAALIPFEDLVMQHCIAASRTFGGMVTSRRFCTSFRASTSAWLSQFDGGTVKLRLEGSLAELELDNLERKNALTGAMMVELAEHVDRLERDAQHLELVVLRGAAQQFCSGGDLNMVKSILNPVDGARMSQFMQEHVSLRLASLPIPTVALVEGYALGGGAELTTVCDMRVAPSTAHIGFVQSRLGITTGWGGATLLARHIGQSQAFRMLSRGKIHNTTGLLEMGLLNGIIDEEDSLRSAIEWCRSRWLAPHAQSMREYKKTLIHREELLQHMRKERRCFARVWGSERHKELLAKGLEK